jgi:hypothetical protein
MYSWMEMELKLLNARLACEGRLMEPVVNQYGVDRVIVMTADIEAEYTAKMAISKARTVDEDQDGDISEGF